MGILSWIIVGFLAGGAARFVTRSEKRGCLGTTVVGVLGAMLGGYVFSWLGEPGLSDRFDLRSVFVAFVGACILLVGLRLISRD